MGRERNTKRDTYTQRGRERTSVKEKEIERETEQHHTHTPTEKKRKYVCCVCCLFLGWQQQELALVAINSSNRIPLSTRRTTVEHPPLLH